VLLKTHVHFISYMQAADRVLSRLLEFLEMGTSSDGVRSEAVVAVKDTLRKVRLSPPLSPPVYKHLRSQQR